MDPNVNDEERNNALLICKTNLIGRWKDVAHSEVKICKVSGGMSNILFYCSLSDDVETISDEPREVFLRIYGPSYCDTEIQLEVYNQLAAENLGPKLHCTFDGGRIEEYLPASPLSIEELTNDDVSAVVAKKIAAIHRLHVSSLKKEPNWLINKLNEFQNFISKTKKNFPTSFGCNKISASTKTVALQILDIDFKPEIELVAKLIQDSHGPLVFSHNDLHQNNILLLHDQDKNLDDRIVLIDFEYCSYNYRMFDLANHLNEQCFNYNASEYPYFEASDKRFPSSDKQMLMLRHYIHQMHRLDDCENLEIENLSSLTNGNNGKVIYHNQAEIDILYREMQPLLLASNLLWSLWAIKSAYTSKINFGYFEMAKMKWNIYQFCKRTFMNS